MESVKQHYDALYNPIFISDTKTQDKDLSFKGRGEPLQTSQQ